VPASTPYNPRAWNVINARMMGARGDGVTNDHAALSAAISSAAAGAGGVVVLPPGNYLCSSQLTVPLNVVIEGAGSSQTTITHTGNGICFKVGGTGTFSHHGMLIQGLRIDGNSGASACGIELGDAYNPVLRDVVVDDYTAGVGIRFFNHHFWTEGIQCEAVRVRNCAVGVDFARHPSSAWNSFGYTNIVGLSVNVPAAGVGIRVGNPTGGLESLVYNSRIEAVVWVASNGAGLQVTSNGTMTAQLFITGEPEGGSTNTTLVSNNGSLLYTGSLFVYPGAFTNVTAGANRPVQATTIDTSSAETSLRPAVHAGQVPGTQTHAGMGAIIAANRENLIAWGYDFGDNPVFQVAARPFSADTGAPWDASSQIQFEVLADGGISVEGNYIMFGNGRSFRSGAGSPEGVVTAPVGSLYTRTDGGLTTTLYVKTSGTGNTGWTGK